MFSAAVRLEYLRDKGRQAAAAVGPVRAREPDHHSEVYGVTGTLAYVIAENLTLKAEVRYDRVVEDTVSGLFPKAFLTNTASGSKDQVVGLAQVIYAF